MSGEFLLGAGWGIARSFLFGAIDQFENIFSTPCRDARAKFDRFRVSARPYSFPPCCAADWNWSVGRQDRAKSNESYRGKFGPIGRRLRRSSTVVDFGRHGISLVLVGREI